VKPAAFEYFAPETRAESLALLATHEDAKPLAGGQSLVPAMNFRLARPAVLVDLNRIADLSDISAGETLRIGAMTRQAALERSPDVAKLAPLVAEAMPHVAHLPIRNRGTIGGNLAHADPCLRAAGRDGGARRAVPPGIIPR
jgi:CO/xanthine dehydrogenase FAD-binding subunit